MTQYLHGDKMTITSILNSCGHHIHPVVPRVPMLLSYMTQDVEASAFIYDQRCRLACLRV